MLINPYSENRGPVGLLAWDVDQLRSQGQDSLFHAARRNARGGRPPSHDSPPTVRPTGSAADVETGQASITHLSATVAEFKAFCSDAHALEDFYDMASANQGAGTSVSAAIPEGSEST